MHKNPVKIFIIPSCIASPSPAYHIISHSSLFYTKGPRLRLSNFIIQTPSTACFADYSCPTDFLGEPTWKPLATLETWYEVWKAKFLFHFNSLKFNNHVWLVATLLDNTSLRIFFYFPLKISTLVDFIFSIFAICLWNLKLHSYRFVYCKHGQVEGWNESWNWNSTWLINRPILAWSCIDTRKKRCVFLAPYLKRDPCSQVYACQPGPCASMFFL